MGEPKEAVRPESAARDLAREKKTSFVFLLFLPRKKGKNARRRTTTKQQVINSITKQTQNNDTKFEEEYKPIAIGSSAASANRWAGASRIKRRRRCGERANFRKQNRNLIWSPNKRRGNSGSTPTNWLPKSPSLKPPKSLLHPKLKLLLQLLLLQLPLQFQLQLKLKLQLHPRLKIQLQSQLNLRLQ